VSRRLVTALPAALLPTAALWVVASQGVFPSPAAIAVTAVVLAALAVVELERGVRITTPAVWLAALVAWATVATVLRPVDPAEAASFLAVGAVALALAVLAARPRVAAWGRLGVVLAGALAAAWLVADRLTGDGRPAGPFENPNIAATVVVIALALVPPLHCHASLRTGVAALLIAGTVASASRAAMLAAAAVGLVWAISVAHRALRVGVGLLVAVAALGLLWRLATDRDPLRFERARIWLVALRTAAAELPLGCGPAGYADAALAHNFAREGELARYNRLPSLAESDPLELAATLGLPGLLLGAGLVVAVARAAAVRPHSLAPVLAIAVTSSMHTQLPLPAVAWTAALAIAGTLRGQRRRRLAAPRGVAVAGACAATAATSFALGVVPDRPATAAHSLAVASAALSPVGRSVEALADAEALAWQACAQRPRWAAAWSLLGSLRLERGFESADAVLVSSAAEAYAEARRVAPLDVWAALGEGRARRALGDAAGAESALGAAVRLEPNCAPAWVELALLRLDGGEMAAARRALGRAEAGLALARGRAMVSDYERAMATVDHLTLARLRLRCGVAR
jgi:tetratricopeptide (TPR) repeat protein